ncbi:hypothetical protein KPATCC21470_7377 [Kitasatospora purpeofusca]
MSEAHAGCCYRPSCNWWLPGWLDRRLPRLHIEGHTEHYQPMPAPEAPCSLAVAR